MMTDTTQCLVKSLRVMGSLLILGLVALNIIYMVWAAKNSEVQDDFGKTLISTFGTVTVCFTLSILAIYIR